VTTGAHSHGRLELWPDSLAVLAAWSSQVNQAHRILDTEGFVTKPPARAWCWHRDSSGGALHVDGAGASRPGQALRGSRAVDGRNRWLRRPTKMETWHQPTSRTNGTKSANWRRPIQRQLGARSWVRPHG